MDPANLATKFADALRAIVPEGFSVTVRDGMVLIDAGSTPWAADVAEIIDTGEVEPPRLAEAAAHETLRVVQGFVTQQLGASWPSSGSLPRVRVTPDAIEMWFENEEGHRLQEVPRIKW